MPLFKNDPFAGLKGEEARVTWTFSTIGDAWTEMVESWLTEVCVAATGALSRCRRMRWCQPMVGVTFRQNPEGCRGRRKTIGPGLPRGSARTPHQGRCRAPGAT